MSPHWAPRGGITPPRTERSSMPILSRGRYLARLAETPGDIAAAQLADLGLTASALSEVAQTLAQARQALDWAVHRFAQQHLHMQGPDVRIDRAEFTALPPELQRRLLVGALCWLSGAGYAPRRQPVAICPWINWPTCQ